MPGLPFKRQVYLDNLNFCAKKFLNLSQIRINSLIFGTKIQFHNFVNLLAYCLRFSNTDVLITSFGQEFSKNFQISQLAKILGKSLFSFHLKTTDLENHDFSQNLLGHQVDKVYTRQWRNHFRSHQDDFVAELSIPSR